MLLSGKKKKKEYLGSVQNSQNVQLLVHSMVQIPSCPFRGKLCNIFPFARKAYEK